jgi:hypothetical protein
LFALRVLSPGQLLTPPPVGTPSVSVSYWQLWVSVVVPALPATPEHGVAAVHDTAPLKVWAAVAGTQTPPPHSLSFVQRQTVGGLDALAVPVEHDHVPAGSVPALVRPGQDPLPVEQRVKGDELYLVSEHAYDVLHVTCASFWQLVWRFTPAGAELEPVHGPWPLHWFWVALLTQWRLGHSASLVHQQVPFTG